MPYATLLHVLPYLAKARIPTCSVTCEWRLCLIWPSQLAPCPPNDEFGPGCVLQWSHFELDGTVLGRQWNAATLCREF